jgi:hypothetical protein
MEGKRVIPACETLSLSGAGWILVIEKGPFGPSFLVINSAAVENVNVPFVKFFPFFNC